MTLEPGARGQSQRSREAQAPLILLLFGVTALVLLIACANIANLLLARAAARASEMAVRLSIGASRWQLDRAAAHRVVLLALLGGVAGLLVARWTLDADHRRCCRRTPPHRSTSRSTAACSRSRPARSRHRVAVRSVPGAAQHPARSRHGAEGPGRAALRRTVGEAVPDDAGDGADRAVDGAAGRRRACSPRACSTSAASTSASRSTTSSRSPCRRS